MKDLQIEEPIDPKIENEPLKYEQTSSKSSSSISLPMIVPPRFRHIASIGSNMQIRSNIIIKTSDEPDEEQEVVNDKDSLSSDNSISSEEIESFKNDS